MTQPTGPADWHLAIGLWQWDHLAGGSDYGNKNPTVLIYDYQHGYNSIYDLHLMSWGNRATCAGLYVGPGYESGDHCDVLSDCNNPEAAFFTLDPQDPPNPNPDHPGIMFYMFKNTDIGEHGAAGLIFVYPPS